MMDEIMPDLSHLTPEERRHIESVMMRQRQEEENQSEILRRKESEVLKLEETIARTRSEMLKNPACDLEATCEICLKTKFADGVGHICNYCSVRCCARCGGKVSLRSNKIIWVCILCRKKQELLSKSGQWMMKPGGQESAMMRRMKEDMQGGVMPPAVRTIDPLQDKRPKLERAQSAVEKENVPLLQRSSSLLRRQYSHQEPGSCGVGQVRRLSTTDSGVDMSLGPHARTLPMPNVAQYQQHQQQQAQNQTPRHPDAFPEDDPSLYRGELDGLMRQNSSYQRQRQLYQEQNSEIAMAYGHPMNPMNTTPQGMMRPGMHPRPQGPIQMQQPLQQPQQQQQQLPMQPMHQQQQPMHMQMQQQPQQQQMPPQPMIRPQQMQMQQPPPPQPMQMHPGPHHLHPGHPVMGAPGQRSFSSSEEERSTPECASDELDDREHGKEQYYEDGGENGLEASLVFNGERQPPSKEEINLARRSFRRSGDDRIADSRRFTERREKKTVRFHGGTSADSQEDWSWEADRQGSQDSATKDSGIETSSNFTSSEDSNRGDNSTLKHPAAPWHPSSDGQKLIGRMVLCKLPPGPDGGQSGILGLKVVGGKLLDDGTIGALIEKVKKGSPADLEGQLRIGDEVLEWNGHSLQGKSFQEVSDIIAMTRAEPQVELVVARDTSKQSLATMMGGGGGPVVQQQQHDPNAASLTPTAARRFAAQAQWRPKYGSGIIGQPNQQKELYDGRGSNNKPMVKVTSPGSPDLYGQARYAANQRQLRTMQGPPPAVAAGSSVGGRLQVKLSFDAASLQLVVSIVCATGLIPRKNGQPRSSYAKMYLLPDRSEKSKRRTKTLANTNEPRWDQSFVYSGIRWTDLRQRSLEITVWDYGRYGANDFLGEVIIALTPSLLNEELEWHYLDEHRQPSYYQDASEDIVTTPGDCHLSPPSTTSRLSDSDTSECDITDCDGSREHRRTADGASISSIGSSSRFHMPPNYKRHYSSPPPEKELCVDGEHRSRRDLSPQGRKRAALMGLREHPASMSGYQSAYRKVNFRQLSDDPHRVAMLSHRSLSAVPMDSPRMHCRGRSQSPTGHRSLSPPDHRAFPYGPMGGYVTNRFSRSATVTPTGSPKKRQLPQIPANLNAALKERVTHDFEERARLMRHRNRPMHTMYKGSMGVWERRFSGLSDSDLPSISYEPHSFSHSHAHRMHRSRRGRISPEKDVLADLGDSDMESIGSVTSSAFSTQSERPRGSRLIPTVKNVYIPGVVSPIPLIPPRRSRRKHRLRLSPCSECHCPLLSSSDASSNNNNNRHNMNGYSSLLNDDDDEVDDLDDIDCCCYDDYDSPLTPLPLPPPRVESSKLVASTTTTTMTRPTTTATTQTTPSNHRGKHPLVRSKSAVVRSLCRKIRAPFARSRTVDEGLLRYNSHHNSPETSEYTVTDAFLLKPRRHHNGNANRIPEIYVEDCLSVNFNKRLIDKFRAKNKRFADITLACSSSLGDGGRRCSSALASLPSQYAARLRSQLMRSSVVAAPRRHYQRLLDYNNYNNNNNSYNLQQQQQQLQLHQQQQHLLQHHHRHHHHHHHQHNPANITRQSSMRRSLLSSRARSFEYDYLDSNSRRSSSSTWSSSRRRQHQHQRAVANAHLARRSRSFECHPARAVSGNVFSDDSLQTARQKIKRNLELSDEGYGDRIPALRDRSRSYYDAGTDAKLRRHLKKRQAREKDLQLLVDPREEPENELDENDQAACEFYADQARPRLMYGYDSELSCGETEIYLPSGDEDEDRRARRKLRAGRSSTQQQGLDNEGYDPSEHIYCSIDEVARGGPTPPPQFRTERDWAFAREIAELSRWRRKNMPLGDGYQRLPPPPRVKSGDAANFSLYDNWSVVDDEGYDGSADRYYDDQEQQQRQSSVYETSDGGVISAASDGQRRARRARWLADGRGEATIATVEPARYENVPYFYYDDDRLSNVPTSSRDDAGRLV
ncbi:regulating synaptic membrane exocytosis protein 2, partial [Trichogramma pretiosum]|uniref:regulating synaptic membrane exocytosis protein 2 n=1 Tax=Trichogramma pretiosum TaxID=7493 RepID=UPI000C718C5A